MFIAVDFSEHDVLELAQTDGQREQDDGLESGANAGLENVPGTRSIATPKSAATAAQLDHWDVQTHQYRDEFLVAVEYLGLCFPVRRRAWMPVSSRKRTVLHP